MKEAVREKEPKKIKEKKEGKKKRGTKKRMKKNEGDSKTTNEKTGKKRLEVNIQVMVVKLQATVITKL